MKILAACEESQALTIACRSLGHEAYSCDIKDCSGGYTEWHIKNDVFEVIDDNWDLIVAFPPCTDLASSGARWFEEKRLNGSQAKSIEFFMKFANLKCNKVAIENPVGIMSNIYRKPDQIIQPWQFGHGETKATCLWLKGLKPLIPTNIVEGRYNKTWLMSPSPDRAVNRSKTYLGIAAAMAEQWTA